MREITAPQKCGFFVFVTTTVTLRPSPIDEFDVVVHALSAQTQEVESPPEALRTPATLSDRPMCDGVQKSPDGIG
jgi:hypothetical protein